MKLVLVAVAVAGCSQHGFPGVSLDPDAQHVVPGDGVDDDDCNVLSQLGCATGQKCTWTLATDPTPTEPGLGAIGCAPNGAIDPGAPCVTEPVAQGGIDHCTGGYVCHDGVCEKICEPGGGDPTCADHLSCVTVDGLFANEGATTTPAGVCVPSCDPLADNDFDGSGSVHVKTGSLCGSDPIEGCYGRFGTSAPTQFYCAQPVPGTGLLTHRATFPGTIYITSCMSGYTAAAILDANGGNEGMCLAFCAPGNAYLGNPDPQLPNGVEPHGCNTTDALGDFGPRPDGSATSNGEHCMFSWMFEIDSQGQFHRSVTSDTVGVCIDHARQRWDSNGDGTIDDSDDFMPPCASLPLTASTTLNAGYFGCVDSTLAGDQPAPPVHRLGMPEFFESRR